MQAQLLLLPSYARTLLAQFVASPYDAIRLKRMEQDLQVVAHDKEAYEQMKTFLRDFGRRERKRPRDRLLRDPGTRAVALDVRKKWAFMGYSYQRRDNMDNEEIATLAEARQQ
jgi:protein-serine/threonine kinase